MKDSDKALAAEILAVIGAWALDPHRMIEKIRTLAQTALGAEIDKIAAAADAAVDGKKVKK